jgi:hypothetical protein
LGPQSQSHAFVEIDGLLNLPALGDPQALDRIDGAKLA